MPPGTDKYIIYDKYYPYKKEGGYKSDYYTVDKSIYDESVHLNKLYKLYYAFAYATPLHIILLILFGAFNIWLGFVFAFMGLMTHIIMIGIVEEYLDTKYLNLWQKFTNTEEFMYQKEQEELYAEIEHQNKVYNILDNKKTSKKNKKK